MGEKRSKAEWTEEVGQVTKARSQFCGVRHRAEQNETRHLRDQLTKMEKRALLAEERAKEAIIMERRARAALEARDKQMASMRMRVR